MSFIRVRSVLGEDVFVNTDRIVSIQAAWKYVQGQRTDMVGATLRMAGDFNIQTHETPDQIIDKIDAAYEADEADEADRADLLRPV